MVPYLCSMLPSFHFDNSYAGLPELLYSRVKPTAVKAPEMVIFNTALAESLGIDVSKSTQDELAQVFSGNALPKGADPIAQAYAGHQFGHFTMLGDGRAILLGEQINPSGKRYDIQLKGSGRTRYSRGGDGRGTLSSMLREYLMSEAMHHLGIPGSRSLAVVLSGEAVQRNGPEPGGILTRVMESHLRVGTFEFARQYLSENDMQALVEHTLERHYPHLAQAENKALALLEAVMDAQIALVCHWMRVGFIHGVMNTDNMHVAGLTFDYGPCAFMNAYHPGTVFSSIDRNGRYAFGNQPGIAQWNLGVLGGALLPLIDPVEDKALELARDVIHKFPERFRNSWERTQAAKLGLSEVREDDPALFEMLSKWMQTAEADYTNTFRALMEEVPAEDRLYASEGFAAFRQKWLERTLTENGGMAAVRERMRLQNPQFIPRNHLVEAALQAASRDGNLSPFRELLDVLRKPYTAQPGAEKYQLAPSDGDTGYQTFCGT